MFYSERQKVRMHLFWTFWILPLKQIVTLSKNDADFFFENAIFSLYFLPTLNSIWPFFWKEPIYGPFFASPSGVCFGESVA